MYFLEFIQPKTKDKVKAPIGKTALALIEKHNDLPRIESTQKSNEMLKELGKLCGFDSICVLEDSKGNVVKEKRQYELMNNHSARRSFCTNAWSMKTDLIQIMKMSGHKTPKVLLEYIDKTLDEYADRMIETDYFNAVNDLGNSVELKAV